MAALLQPRPTAGESDPTLADAVKKALPETPGACVLAADRGRVVFKHAYGLADVANDVACTPATNFRMASVSKQFTAFAVMMLVERGKISLDDALDKYFPGFPEWGRTITVRHLLTHTSGLPDYENLIPKGTTLQLDDLDAVHLLMDAKKPLFAPGEKWQYSNSGFTLLGMIVEIAADVPFHEFVRQEIFEPLGMNKSVLYQRGLNEVTNRAFGHEEKDGKWVGADQSLTSAIRGDGVVYTSLNDYVKWLAGLDRRKLLSAESYDAIFTPHEKTDRAGAHYGYGWFIDSYRGEKRVFHNGDTRGFRLTVHMFPDRRAAVVVQLNGDIPDDMTKLGEKLADVLIFDAPPPP
jgi:CubicO group peptidase (beta-lactamase class C family)